MNAGNKEARSAAAKPIYTHVFTREEVSRCDAASFVSRFSPEKLPSEALRLAYDSLGWRLSGFDDETRDACEIPEVRSFLRVLHHVWPHAFFFFNIPAADLWTYLLCQLTTLTTERRKELTEPLICYNRNELFRVICDSFDPLERACQQSELGREVFRCRARQILVMFGFLKA